MQNESVWRGIVLEALKRALERREEPVPGALLRSIVSRLAREKELEFPPEDAPKFSNFLDTFGDVLTVLARPGQDILVVPKDRGDLLAPQNSVTAGRIREDLYRAFSHVKPGVRNWYDPAGDKVVERPEGEAPAPGEIALPTLTEDDERELRRKFIEQHAPDDTVRAALEESLGAPRPLAAFSRVVHEAGLKRRWGSYHVAAIFARINGWVQESGTRWKSGWLVSETHQRLARDETVAGSGTPQQRLARLILSLSDADLARVSLPVDLALRIVDRG